MTDFFLWAIVAFPFVFSFLVYFFMRWAVKDIERQQFLTDYARILNDPESKPKGRFELMKEVQQ